MSCQPMSSTKKKRMLGFSAAWREAVKIVRMVIRRSMGVILIVQFSSCKGWIACGGLYDFLIVSVSSYIFILKGLGEVVSVLF